MAKYAYPALLTAADGCYYVRFPDIENCFTDGDTLPEAIEMAEDVLALTLCRMEDCGEALPEPSELRNIGTSHGETASLIFCDTAEYRRLYSSRAVKKTLSIPAWLNTRAEKEGINFSAVLQSALKEELHIQD